MTPWTASASRRGDLAALLRPELFRALSEPMRVSLLAVLAQAESPQTVGQLAESCDIDPSGVSRHLKTLREAGLLDARRSGREVRYAVRLDALTDELRALADAIDACCPPS
jgi:DNA-binding transcriptional ArsR family regulator